MRTLIAWLALSASSLLLSQIPAHLDRLNCGDLSPTELRQWQDLLAAEPNNPNAHSCLLVQAQLHRDWTAYAQHLIWAIENGSPETPSLVRSATPLRAADPALFATVQAKLLGRLDKVRDLPEAAGLRLATASLLAESDLPLALHLLESVYSASPRPEPGLVTQLGRLYALACLRDHSSARATLDASRDPYLLRAAAQHLLNASSPSLRPYGQELRRRAQELNPKVTQPIPAGLSAEPFPRDPADLGRLTGPDPIYPAAARQAGIEGTVHFQITIDREGKVRDMRLLSGHPLLVPAATEAVRQWTFRPTLLNGQPTVVGTTIDVPFTLKPSP